MIRNLYEEPRYVLLVIALIAVCGVAGFSTRPRLEDPQSNVRRGQIATFLPGATPTEVESQVTEPIEMALREAVGIRNIESSSRRGVSVVFIRLTDTVRDVSRTWSKIEDKLSEVVTKLPEGASKPMLIDERRWDSYTSVVAIVEKVSNNTQHEVLSRWATELESRLRFVPGTRFTEIFGLPQDEILVEVTEECIASSGITLAEIAQKIGEGNSLASNASAQTVFSRMPVKMSGNIDSLYTLRNTPIRQSDSGSLLLLKDISNIQRSEHLPASHSAFVDGRRAAVIGSRMDTDHIIDNWTAQHEKTLEEFKQTLPAELELRLLFSQKRYTDERSHNLYYSLLFGMLSVIVVVWVMMGWRAAFPVCSALPLTLLVVFFLMIPFGVSLHQTSIAGLILALGLLVDNPIIVVDDMQRRLKIGLSPIDAALKSIGHLFSPLVASNLTTVLMFTPLLLIPGTTGEYLGHLGWTVIACILVSLTLSLTTIPVIAAWLLIPAQEKLSHLKRNGRYGLVLRWMMSHRLILLVLSSAIPFAGFIVAGSLEEQFFPHAERDHFHFSIRLPNSSTTRATEVVAKQASEIIRGYDNVEDVFLFIGSNAPMVHYSMVAGEENSPEFAQGIVTIRGKVRPSFVNRIQQDLDEALTEAATKVTLIEQGPPTIAPIEFRIYGPSIEQLHVLGEIAQKILLKVPGVIHTRATLDIGGPELTIKSRSEDSESASLSQDQIGKQLKDQLDGVVVSSFEEDAENVPIRVRIKAGHMSSPERVLSLPIVTDEGKVISLNCVADWAIRSQLAAVTRRDSSRCNIIQCFVAAGSLPIELEKQFKIKLAEHAWELPAGYRTDFGGVSEERNSAVGNLLAYAAIIGVLMVSVLVFSFRSFRATLIIGLIAVLSSGCGLLSLWLFNFPIGLMAIIGLLGLIGIAINDSIVVLSDSKLATAAGFQLYESIASSTRHVLTTSFSTAAGVSPLIIAGGEFWPPMMVVIGGGVIGGTFLSLGFAPALYSLICQGNRMNFLQWKRMANVGQDEWIVLTGSTSGIGNKFLERLCEAGCNVLTVSNEESKLFLDKEAMEAEFGVRIACRCIELSNFEAVMTLGEELKTMKVVGLINNAGFGMKGDFLSHSISRYVDIIAVNSTAPVILQHAILPQLREMNRGLVINVASINAYVPVPNNQVYTATKAFLMSFALAVEAENDGKAIVFQLLLPGTTMTPFHDKQGVSPPARSTMTVDEVVDYSLNNLDRSICIPNSRDRILSKIIGGPIPKKAIIAWVKREAERRLGMTNRQS
jgi:multidrug efflux pump